MIRSTKLVSIPSISVILEELDSMLYNENVLHLDVRPPVEYEFGHITGAVSIPKNELMNKLQFVCSPMKP